MTRYLHDRPIVDGGAERIPSYPTTSSAPSPATPNAARSPWARRRDPRHCEASPSTAAPRTSCSPTASRSTCSTPATSPCSTASTAPPCSRPATGRRAAPDRHPSRGARAGKSGTNPPRPKARSVKRHLEHAGRSFRLPTLTVTATTPMTQSPNKGDTYRGPTTSDHDTVVHRPRARSAADPTCTPIRADRTARSVDGIDADVDETLRRELYTESPNRRVRRGRRTHRRPATIARRPRRPRHRPLSGARSTMRPAAWLPGTSNVAQRKIGARRSTPAAWRRPLRPTASNNPGSPSSGSPPSGASRAAASSDAKRPSKPTPPSKVDGNDACADLIASPPQTGERTVSDRVYTRGPGSSTRRRTGRTRPGAPAADSNTPHHTARRTNPTRPDRRTPTRPQR